MTIDDVRFSVDTRGCHIEMAAQKYDVSPLHFGMYKMLTQAIKNLEANRERKIEIDGKASRRVSRKVK